MRLAPIVLFALAVMPGQLAPAAIAPGGQVTLEANVTSLGIIKRSVAAAVTRPGSQPMMVAPSIAAGLANGHVAIWNGRDAKVTMLTPHTSPVLAVGSSADGLAVWSVAEDGSLARTSIAPGGESTPRHVDLGTVPTRAAVFSDDGSMLVTGGEFGEIRVFDTALGVLKQQLRGHRTELQVLALRPGSSILASASAESDLRIWDAATGQPISASEGDLSLFALAFSPADGTLASGGADRRLTLRNPSTYKPVSEMALKAPWMVGTLAWSPDGHRIALGDLDDETLAKGTIQVLDAATRAVVRNLDTGNVAANAVVFLGQDSVVAVVKRDLRAWMIPGS